MKFKHLLVFTVVFALVALGTSCSKPTEKKIIGKWQVVSEQERDSYDPEWDIDYSDPDEVYIYEFQSKGVCSLYYNNVLLANRNWSYDKATEKLIIGNESFDVITCTSKELTLGYKEVDDNYWYEGQVNFKKVK